MSLKDTILLFVSQNEDASNRFKHFLLAAVKLPSMIHSAVITSDNHILIKQMGDIGYNDFPGWDVPHLSDNLNRLADVLQLTTEERSELFDACVGMFDIVDGKIPLLIPMEAVQ